MASANYAMFDDILIAMKSIAIVISLLVSSFWIQLPAHAGEQTLMAVKGEFWMMPRHGELLLAQEPLRHAVQQLLQESEGYLVVNYPSSESGELWGLEFQAWLVSLGIVSDRIELRPGYEGDEGIAIIMVMPAVEPPPAPLSVESAIVEPAPEEQSIQENSSPGRAVDTGATTVQDEVESQ